jgi:hypothetical protein
MNTSAWNMFEHVLFTLTRTNLKAPMCITEAGTYRTHHLKKETKHHQEQRTTFLKNQEPKKNRFGAGVKLNGYATIDHEGLQDKSPGHIWILLEFQQHSPAELRGNS